MDIEKLAREAGLIEPRDVWADLPSDYRGAISSLAALVLEEAAKVCESVGKAHSDYPFAKLASENCARRIRAISTTTPPQEHNNG